MLVSEECQTHVLSQRTLISMNIARMNNAS
jgi:hypothetical protein